MLEVIERCFGCELASERWQAGLREMIPSFGRPLVTDARLAREVQDRTTEALELHEDHDFARGSDGSIA
jgi:malate dehydrogenase (quinone)